jgi:hypothetical protein
MCQRMGRGDLHVMSHNVALLLDESLSVGQPIVCVKHERRTFCSLYSANDMMKFAILLADVHLF